VRSSIGRTSHRPKSTDLYLSIGPIVSVGCSLSVLLTSSGLAIRGRTVFHGQRAGGDFGLPAPLKFIFAFGGNNREANPHFDAGSL
jgi:hypothetical protein